MAADQHIAANASMTFSMLDELVDAVKDLGADCLMVRFQAPACLPCAAAYRERRPE